MNLEKRYQSGMGTKGQLDGILNILKVSKKIKVKLLERKLLFLRPLNYSQEKEIYFYNIELEGSIKELENYFEILKNDENVFFNDLDNSTS